MEAGQGCYTACSYFGTQIPEEVCTTGVGGLEDSHGVQSEEQARAEGTEEPGRELVGTARGGGLAGFSQQAAVEGSGVKVRKPRFPMFFRAQK